MTLPAEVLQKIFFNLNGAEVIKCRAVCKLWKAAVDGLSDSQWNMICRNEIIYPTYKKVHEISAMSWRDTFVALNSWANIESAEMEYRQLPTKDIYRFQLLPNRIIAVLTRSNRDWYFDTIVYHNIDTLKVIKRKTFYHDIRQFYENEHFIVLLCGRNKHICDDMFKLVLVQKANNNQEIAMNVHSTFDVRWPPIGLFGKKVYFQGEDGRIYLFQLKETKEGKSIIETAALKAIPGFEQDGYGGTIICFGYKDDNLMVLTYGCKCCNIYNCVDNDYHLLGKFAMSRFDDVAEKLGESGFDWMLPILLRCYITNRDNSDNTITKYHSVLIHGPMLLYCSNDRPECVLYNYHPLGQDDELQSYKRAHKALTDDANRSHRLVDVNEFLDPISKSKPYRVEQMDVVESAEYHEVIIVVSDKLFFLKFGFEATNETN